MGISGKRLLIRVKLIGRGLKWISLCALIAPDLSQAVSWKWRYKVLVSPHFEIIYREDQKDLAKHYLLASERAYELLMPLFKEGPENTTIFLEDDTDNANGAADFLPFPHITVFPVLPTTLDTIDDYGDWAFEIMLHEFTHILNMYPAHGIYAPFKYIFGTVVRPNAVLPTWYLEGLAVYAESVFSDHGRLRSSETRASARALVVDERLRKENLARVNENSIPSWPFGARPYVFGAWYWQTLHREKELALVEPLNQDFARRLPFLINGPFRERAGRAATQVYADTVERVNSEAKREITRIQASGLQPKGESVGEERGEFMVFAISPSGRRLVYWRRTPSLDAQGPGPGLETGTQAKLKERSAPGTPFKDIPGKLLFKATSSTQVRWLDDDRFIYDQVDVFSPYTSYRDLYLYDLKTRTSRRLTGQARAQEASPSPSNQDVAFIANDGGRNHLALLNIASGEIQRLVSSAFNQRLSSPVFLNDKQILFVSRARSGDEKIFAYNLETRESRPWNERLKAAQNLRKTANGFLVTDSGTQVRNVYWLHDGKTDAVSNTLTDIETADYDPQRKELIYSELTGTGHRLKAIPFAQYRPPTLGGAQLPPPPQPKNEDVPLREENYQPFSYLVPKFWVPFAYQVENGLLLQGETFNQDPAGRNAYTLLGAYDTVTRRGSYGASYTNNSLPAQITLAYAKTQVYLGASAAVFESQHASALFSQYWPFNNKNMTWFAGGLWADTLDTFHQMGPTVGWQYSNLHTPLNRYLGYHIEAAHTQYLNKPNYIGYGRSYIHMADLLNLGGGHRVFFQVRAAFAPKLPFQDSVLLGDRNVGANYLVNLVNSNFLLRGYPSGEFVGRKIVNANLEYLLPAWRLDQGWGTFPLFLQNLELAFFADTIAVDGAGFDTNSLLYRVQNLQQFHTGTGLELRLNSDAFYHLPLSFTLGLYYGLSERFGGGFAPFLGIGMGELSSLGGDRAAVATTAGRFSRQQTP